MNWLHNHYFGEGRGIAKNAPRATGLRLLAQVLSREWWPLIQLNLVFIAFCLPLVTIPAAYAALVSVTVAMIEDRNVYVFRDFWKAFRSSALVASVVGIALIGAGALTGLAIKTYAAGAANNLAFALPLALAIFFAAMLPAWAANFFVALATARRKTFSGVLKSATLGLLAYPLAVAAAVAVMGLLWLSYVMIYPVSAILPVLVYFSFGAVITSFAALKGVRPDRWGTPTETEDARTRPMTQSA